jgi:Arc/MetJ-type ribon-helix-helix transcriptional regulator
MSASEGEEHKVTVQINQQQAAVIDRLVRGGQYGTSRAEVIRAGFAEFCKAHPELFVEDAPESAVQDEGDA